MLKIKMCGMKDLASAQAAEAAGVDFIGFIFYPPSHRNISLEQARNISQALQQVKKVGVFVDERPEYVNETAAFCGLDYVQLHGHESAAYAAKIQRPIIKAYRWGDDFSVAEANRYPAEIILLDSYHKKLAGGTGMTFAWREAAQETAKLQKPLLVAGGISRENAWQAVRIFQPYGLDVSGSLEIDGEKSTEKIHAFMDSMRMGDAR